MAEGFGGATQVRDVSGRGLHFDSAGLVREPSPYGAAIRAPSYLNYANYKFGQPAGQQALAFDGSDPITISCIFKATDDGGIFAKRSSGSGANWAIDTFSNTFRFYFSNAGWHVWSVPITYGKWYHAVVTYNRLTSGCRIWLDGVEQTVTRVAGSGLPANDQFQSTYVYMCNWYSSDPFDAFAGSIAGINLWRRELNDGDVQGLTRDPWGMFQRQLPVGRATHAPTNPFWCFPSQIWRERPRAQTLCREHGLAKGLVGAWYCDGGNSLVDVTGRFGRTDLTSGFTTTTAYGRGHTINVAGDPVLVLATDPFGPNVSMQRSFSMGAWVRPTTAGTGTAAEVACFVSTDGDSPVTNHVFLVRRSGNGGLVSQYDLNGNNDVYSWPAASVPAGWHHVMLTRDYVGGVATHKVYLDGVHVGTGSHAGVPDSADYIDAFGIGLSVYGWEGQIDFPMLYDRALAANEVMSLYRDPWGMFQRQLIVAKSVSPPPAAVSISGSASASLSVSATGAAAVVISGSAAASLSASATGASPVSASGSAVASISATASGVPVATVSGSASASLSASAAATVRSSISGSASASISASCVGSSAVVASGSASASMSASAVGATVTPASGSAAASLSASAAGSKVAVAGGSASASLSATAAGASFVGVSGSAAASLSASAAGAITVSAAGSAAASLSAGASGAAVVPASGSATASLSAASAGSAVAVATGSATASLLASAAGVSCVSASGSASASLSASGAAVSTLQVAGSASASLSASAAGDAPVVEVITGVNGSLSAAAPTSTKASAPASASAALSGAAPASTKTATPATVSASLSVVAPIAELTLAGASGSLDLGPLYEEGYVPLVADGALAAGPAPTIDQAPHWAAGTLSAPTPTVEKAADADVVSAALAGVAPVVRKTASQAGVAAALAAGTAPTVGEASTLDGVAAAITTGDVAGEFDRPFVEGALSAGPIVQPTLADVLPATAALTAADWYSDAIYPADGALSVTAPVAVWTISGVELASSTGTAAVDKADDVGAVSAALAIPGAPTYADAQRVAPVDLAASLGDLARPLKTATPGSPTAAFTLLAVDSIAWTSHALPVSGALSVGTAEGLVTIGYAAAALSLGDIDLARTVSVSGAGVALTATVPRVDRAYPTPAVTLAASVAAPAITEASGLESVTLSLATGDVYAERAELIATATAALSVGLLSEVVAMDRPNALVWTLADSTLVASVPDSPLVWKLPARKLAGAQTSNLTG